jgi:hypothetical protein
MKNEAGELDSSTGGVLPPLGGVLRLLVPGQHIEYTVPLDAVCSFIDKHESGVLRYSVVIE